MNQGEFIAPLGNVEDAVSGGVQFIHALKETIEPDAGIIVVKLHQELADVHITVQQVRYGICLLYTSPSPRDS